jgi:parallel beta-helix repeat protein
LIQKLTLKSANKYGIYCKSGESVTVTFKNNIIKDSGWGIVAEDNCQLIILNNLIYNNKNSVNTDGAGILVKNNFSYGITSEIRNNTIDGNYHGIWSENSNSKVINNIVSSNIGGKGAIESTGIYHSGTGVSDNTYSDIWGNGFDYNGDATTGNGTLNADPRFVNAYNNDYRLKTGSVDYSPCLDAGHPDMIYWDATYSSNTARNDMGAYGGPDNISW